jgi:homoserine/homoserine lactone efflux protein
MTATRLLIFAGMELVLSMTPGLAVLLVVSHGMRGGWRAGVRAALGILTGNAIYFALSAAGVGALLVASPRAFQAMRWAGVAYLLFIGATMLFSRPSPREERDTTPLAPRAFVQGLVTQLANPKAIVFFTAFLPQFIDPHAPMTRQFLLLGVISIVVELPVLVVYAIAADRGGHLLSGRILNRVAGAFLVAAALKLAL